LWLSACDHLMDFLTHPPYRKKYQAISVRNRNLFNF
jgi:hypothetical protein